MFTITNPNDLINDQKLPLFKQDGIYFNDKYLMMTRKLFFDHKLFIPKKSGKIKSLSTMNSKKRKRLIDIYSILGMRL